MTILCDVIVLFVAHKDLIFSVARLLPQAVEEWKRLKLN